MKEILNKCKRFLMASSSRYDALTFDKDEVMKIYSAAHRMLPKKPTLIDDGHGMNSSTLCCPHCHNPIVNVWSKADYNPENCHCCGQKLDWSVEE